MTGPADRPIPSGEKGASRYFVFAIIATAYPDALRQLLATLRQQANLPAHYGATLILDEFGSPARVRNELRRVMAIRGIPRQFKRVQVKRSKSEPLIQIADLVAGAILRRDSKGDVDAYDYIADNMQQVLEFTS